MNLSIFLLTTSNDMLINESTHLRKGSQGLLSAQKSLHLVKNLGEHVFVQYWHILRAMWNHCGSQGVQDGQLSCNKTLFL